MAACHYGIPRGRADRVGGVAAGEAHPCSGDAIAVRGFVKGFRVVGSNVHVTQIVHEKEDYVGLSCCGGGCCDPGGNKGEEGQKVTEHSGITVVWGGAWQVEWQIFLRDFPIFRFRSRRTGASCIAFL